MSKKIIKDINSNKNFATINTDNNNKNNSREASMESNEKEKRFITEIPIKSYKNKNFFKNNS